MKEPGRLLIRAWADLLTPSLLPHIRKEQAVLPTDVFKQYFLVMEIPLKYAEAILNRAILQLIFGVRLTAATLLALHITWVNGQRGAAQIFSC